MKWHPHLTKLLKRLTVVSHLRRALLSTRTGSAEAFKRLLLQSALPVRVDSAYHISV